MSISSMSMITDLGLPQYGSTVVAGLITFLSLKEVLSTSEQWNRNLNDSFNLVIRPLLLCFVAIVVYKVGSII
jgi:hypothetical protein